MKIYIFIFSLLLIFFVHSCRQDENKIDEFRSNLDLKSELAQKEAFKDLSTSEKIDLWDSKLNQVLKQDLNAQQRDIVKQIRNEIPKLNSEDYEGVKLIELAIAMAKITPEDEFVRMFSMVGNYKRNDNAYRKTFQNDLIVNDLENFLNTVKTNNLKFYENNTTTANKKPVCNCKWTCGMYGGVNDNCTESNSGCGFLWLQACTGVIGV